MINLTLTWLQFTYSGVTAILIVLISNDNLFFEWFVLCSLTCCHFLHSTYDVMNLAILFHFYTIFNIVMSASFFITFSESYTKQNYKQRNSSKIVLKKFKLNFGIVCQTH